MTQYIDKSALVAEIKNMKGCKKSDWHFDEFDEGYKSALEDILSFINTLEVKEIGINIPNINDLFEEDGIDPYSKDAKLFKECYYIALERYKEKKGIV